MFEKLEKMHQYRSVEDESLPVFDYHLVVGASRHCLGYYAMVVFNDGSGEIADIGEDHETIPSLLDLERKHGLVYPLALGESIQQALENLDVLINTKIPTEFDKIIEWVCELDDVRVDYSGFVIYSSRKNRNLTPRLKLSMVYEDDHTDKE